MYKHKIKPAKSFELQGSSNVGIFKTFVNALTVGFSVWEVGRSVKMTDMKQIIFQLLPESNSDIS